MKKYSVTCTCGHDMTVESATKEEAAEMLKKMMDQNGVDGHWADKHANDTSPKPTVEQCWAMIDQTIHEQAETLAA